MSSALSADGLVGDSDPSLKQHFLNVAQTEREPVIEPDSTGDDLWRETMVLLWLPPVVQEVSDLLNVRSSAVFCQAFYVRHFQKPLAGMVICGSGPNLVAELSSSKNHTGFPYPDRFDHAPIQVIDFSHLLTDFGYLWSASNHAATTNAGSR